MSDLQFFSADIAGAIICVGFAGISAWLHARGKADDAFWGVLAVLVLIFWGFK